MRLTQLGGMQRMMPLALVLVLAIFAIIFSFQKPAAPLAEKKTVPMEATKNKPESVTAQAKQTMPAAPKVAARPWPQENSDIPADSQAIFGSLPNGMRYLIYPNSEPPKRVSMRLHIRAGSLMEQDDQQGLAHFLEHMLFNGTRHFKSEELVPKMQRLGIAFGAHANAYTSFDETVYMLDLPDLTDDTTKLAFDVMRDFGDGALLEQSEIDKERGVILAEKISRDTVQSRVMEQQFTHLLPDTLIAKRFPIGKEDVIKKANRDRFVDFYQKYYRPERITFIVVGDVDPEVYRKRIEETFSTMAQPGDAGTDPEIGAIKIVEGLETSVFSDPELSSTDLSLVNVRPYQVIPDTIDRRKSNLALSVAHSMISRRFERASKAEGAPISSGSASRYVLFNHSEIGSIDVTVADERWKEAIPLLEQQFRSAMMHGFSAAEVAESESNILNAYQQQVDRKPTRKSEGIATVLIQTLNEGQIFSTPEKDLELAKAALDSLTADDYHQALKTFWETSGMHLVLTTKEKPEMAEKDMAAIFEESRGVPVLPPAQTVAKAFDYETFGKPGAIESRKEIADLGITQLVLNNQVRINLKPTPFEKNRIELVASIGHGKLTQPKDKPMLDLFSNNLLEGGGLGKHSVEDLQQILAGRNVSSSFMIGDGAIELSGATTPNHFQLQAQLMCAMITDPGYREEALWQFQKSIPEIFQQLKHTPSGPMQEMEAWLNGGDSRFTLTTAEQLGKYSIADAKAWINPQLSNSYLELSIVGDFSIDTILQILLDTFGALPKRESAPKQLDAARLIKRPTPPAIKEFTYQSKIAQATAIAIWQTPGLRNNRQAFRRYNVLAEIFGDRLREEVREKLGASYSPNAGATGSEVYENVGSILSQSVGKPEDLPLLLKTMRELADAFAQNGATADELDRALKPTLGQLEKSLRDNTYWLSVVMNRSQEIPENLELARTRDADYRSISLAEINSLAKKILGSSNSLSVSIFPKE
ncbi:MAG: insulinase family protein [Verrucomicrobia bacterium]|nr:MAG: insulinase family protein [Verrucomicrobiota bacterium]